MDQETLYTKAKWDILKKLKEQELSPIELSVITGMSLANISAQLRMLEMAGIVTSKRVPNRDKGLPRLVYSLAQDSCYVITTANNFVEKKRLAISPSHQVVLKIWFLENQELRMYCEKAFWKVEEHLQSMQALLVDTSSTKPLCMYVVSNETIDVPSIQELRDGAESRSLTISQLSKDDAKEFGHHLLPLYDPQGIFE